MSRNKKTPFPAHMVFYGPIKWKLAVNREATQSD